MFYKIDAAPNSRPQLDRKRLHLRKSAAYGATSDEEWLSEGGLRIVNQRQARQRFKRVQRWSFLVHLSNNCPFNAGEPTNSGADLAFLYYSLAAVTGLIPFTLDIRTIIVRIAIMHDAV